WDYCQELLQSLNERNNKISSLCAGEHTMSLISKTVIFTILTSTLANASEKAAHVSKDSLHYANVPLYDLIDLSVLKVSDLAVTSYENNSLSPVRVRNAANKAIESILLLIEFLDVANNHLETSLYYATTHRFPDNLLRVQKGFGVQRLTSSLGPNSD